VAIPPADRRGFVFVGRLVESKGVDTLIAAYARTSLDRRAWPLTIVGDGPRRRAIETQCAREGLPGVRLLGFVDEQVKAREIGAAKWLVAPSSAHEGLGLVVLEARDVGVPCIVTRHGGLPEAAGAEALMCEPGDVSGLAASLEMAAGMAEADYESRSRRTRATLADQLVPLSFYADAYLGLAAIGSGAHA
jgi:glycosyltransferase involved in cell wall biosynthesis